MDFHQRETEPKSRRKQPSELPKSIEGHRILRFLERGGMSLIYLGSHETTGELVILKTLSQDFLQDEEVIERFLKEAEIIRRADHPNIVKLYTHGPWEGGFFHALEYIEGTSLKEILTESPLPLKKALNVVLEIAYAVCHLHSQGIIHRDLKLENILLTREGKVKMIDFGIAHIEDEPIAVQKKRRVVGTPVYMSPEQRVNPDAVSYPSDIYSLGIIAYELILGKLSHGKVHLSLVPKGLQQILAKSLHPNPKERYQDVVDLISDLSAYISSSKIESDLLESSLLSELSEEMALQREEMFSSPSLIGSRFSCAERKKLSLRSTGFLTFFKENRLLLLSSSKQGPKGFLENVRLKGAADLLLLDQPLKSGVELSVKESCSYFYLEIDPDYQIHFEGSPLWTLRKGKREATLPNSRLEEDNILFFTTLPSEIVEKSLASLHLENEGDLEGLATKIFSLLSPSTEALYFLLLKRI